MYKIAILDKDKAYLERLILFLEEHHSESFEINAMNGLDDFGTKDMQCNALFFGDDVAVDEALFPEDIAIGYLTEKEETSEQYINKYQSMEKIYRRMLKLCGERRVSGTKACEPVERQEKPAKQVPAEHYDLKAETVTAEGETYRIYHIEEEQVDRLAVRMLTGNHIKGIFQTEYRDNKLKLRITGMKSLYEYVQDNNTSKDKEQLLKYFADMLTTALSLEEYMLSADKLMLNPREIYVNEAENKVLIPYIPLKDVAPKDSRRCLEEIRGLCSVLIDGISEEALHILTVADICQEPQESYDSAEEPDSQQESAKEQAKPKDSAETSEKEVLPYIVRKRTREKIVIDRSPFKLGKDASCVDYCMKDNPAVSRNHADIVRKPDGYYLVDKGSLNHTFVNGKKLAADEYRKLEHGCLMQLANEVFEFRLK
ncbi:MAG: FHA domain-containing protein [Lachnospiraceae bacterium]|nr:FHA domain-containing protein [Lachnospiraceae bacterium]